MSRWSLSTPGAQDLPELLALLESCALPGADLTGQHLAEFLVCREGGRIVGSAGLEFCADAVLLRSLAVAASHRRSGLASRLVAALSEQALARGRSEMFLLTTSAVAFFAALGFRRVDRQRVPPAVAATAEFRTLCPASAVCMQRQLTPSAAA